MYGTFKVFVCSFLIACPLAVTGACATTYVRVPAVCPSDPLCLDERPDAGAAARARERDYVRRHAEATVEVRGIRYLPNKGPLIAKGVGTLVGPKGYVLTAMHPIDGAEVVTVTLRTVSPDGGTASSRDIPAIPLSLSREADLALLVLPAVEKLPPSLPVRYGPVIKNDEVFFLGAGSALKRGRVAETGIILGHGSFGADASIASTADDGGAPLLNVCGEVVGVTAGPYGKKGRLRFVPIDDALRLLSITPADFR